MAVTDGPSGPDFGAILSLNNFSNQAGIKPAPLLLLVPGSGVDTDVFKGLSSQGKGFNAEGMINKLPQGRPNWAQRLGKSIRDSLAADAKKANDAGAPKQTDVTQMAFSQTDMSSITGPTFPRGGGDFGIS